MKHHRGRPKANEPREIRSLYLPKSVWDEFDEWAKAHGYERKQISKAFTALIKERKS